MPRPTPAAPAVSLTSNDREVVPTARPTGSVTWNPQSILKAAAKAPRTHAPSSASPSMAPSSTRGTGHRVYQSLQREKLLTGCERELGQANITVTVLLALLGLMRFDWHLLVVAFIFGGPVQWALRMYGGLDPDHFKTYLEALSIPHLRRPE
jgi:type IV secretory pathway TrbD component